MSTEEVVQETTEEVVENPVEDVETVEAAPEAEAEGEPTAEASAEGEIPQYNPNFKFNVKGKELEFDEWVQPFVKDEETEKRFRDIFERAHGLDEVKNDRQSLRAELKTVREEKAKIDESLQHLSSFVQAKDYRSFFEALGIPKADVLKYAVEELKYQEMSPEQRYEIDARRSERQRLSQLEMQNQRLQQTYEQQLREQKTAELDAELQRPDIQTIAQSYDARAGQAGAFRNEVIARGTYYETAHGQIISVKQAVDEVLRLMGGPQQSPAQQAGQQTQAAGQSQAPVIKKDKPVIPSMGGGSSGSPARRQPRSIEDLRKLYDERANA